MNPTTLLFGSAGIPLCTKPRDTFNGIAEVNNLGLGAMELEFVRSIHITKEKAPDVNKAAKKAGIVLTCHAPYYINLNSKDKAKLHASKERILNSARIAHACGAWSVCFHPAFYMKEEPAKVYPKVRDALKDIMKTLENEEVNIWVRPETTGKGSAFGDLDECIKLSRDIPHVLPCIDFAHLHARSNGKINSYTEFCDVLEKMEKLRALDKMHVHYNGIRYSEKGELNHLTLKDSDAKYGDLMKAFKKFKVKGVIISESPNIEKDALLLQKTYKSN